ncbi:MAG: radical SAM protein [Methanomassiliicoccaceae archaeon]|nr:radical SAM protein [Methanomassiliicoccaceae archaeon]
MKICETFVSLQGEGLMMGVPTLFIRTVGCNLDCSWCDTKYAFSGGYDASIGTLAESAADISNICVTGGEPMLQDELPELLDVFLSEGKHVVLETNGSIDVSGLPKDENLMISMDIKCPSSGMTNCMMMSNIAVLGKKDQLKFIISDDADFEFAVDVLKKYTVGTNVIFSPVGGMDLRPLAEKVLSRKLEVRVLPQLHKIIWGDRRSV